MDNKISTYSPAFSIVSWVALIGGIVTYLLGLWNAEMQLNEKGYYFAVLVLGLFSAASYQKTVRDKYEGIPTTPIYYMTCLTVFIMEGANKRGNSSRLTQSFHFFMFEPIFSPVNALNQPI